MMGKTVSPLFLSCFFIHSFLYLQVIMTCMRARTSSNFGQIGPRAVELRPLKDVRNWFLLNILRMDGQNLTKFCIHIIKKKWQDLYCYCKASFFCKFATELQPLIDVRNWFLAQYLENGWTEFDQILYTLYHWQDLCLYCKGSFFYKFATELQPLIDVRNCFFVQYLENG